jgi:hypothetical protein
MYVGKLVYDGLKIASMCDSCHAQKRVKCEHVEDYERPPWKSLDKEEEVRVQYGNNDAKLRREIYGVAESDEMSVFQQCELDLWKHRDTYTFDRPPDHIFITIDTSGGGGSDTAWTALAFNSGDKAVVCCSPHCPLGSHLASHRLLTVSSILI